jgi:hypothetical protein
MKTYTFTDLRKIAKDQNYKMACLQNSQGDKIQNNNNIKVKLENQLKTIETRLSSDLYPDGIYYVCMSQTINTSKNPDRYPVAKGNVKPEMVIKDTPIIHTVSEDVLTWDSALKLHQEIADLKNKLAFAQYENNALTIELDELRKQEELHEAEPTKDISSFLKDSLPSVIPILDEYFKLEGRKLDIKDKEINLKANQKAQQRKPLIVGSNEHLALIKFHFDNGNEDKLNAELDKLEGANYELYKNVCEQLGIVDGEEQNNGE